MKILHCGQLRVTFIFNNFLLKRRIAFVKIERSASRSQSCSNLGLVKDKYNALIQATTVIGVGRITALELFPPLFCLTLDLAFARDSSVMNLGVQL